MTDNPYLVVRVHKSTGAEVHANFSDTDKEELLDQIAANKRTKMDTKKTFCGLGFFLKILRQFAKEKKSLHLYTRKMLIGSKNIGQKEKMTWMP